VLVRGVVKSGSRGQQVVSYGVQGAERQFLHEPRAKHKRKQAVACKHQVRFLESSKGVWTLRASLGGALGRRRAGSRLLREPVLSRGSPSLLEFVEGAPELLLFLE
jgi:hypothetical protein